MALVVGAEVRFAARSVCSSTAGAGAVANADDNGGRPNLASAVCVSL
jgi:hypothetical protein